MNYRHAFHAGNFADVFKHVLLCRILVYLQRKPGAFRYIDTHAGIGWYDLDGAEANRTGEWREGIGRLDPDQASTEVRALLAPYLDAVGQRDGAGKPLSYPGSPGLAQTLLRPGDRMLLCERHPEDAATLRQAMGRDKRVRIVECDGYTGLKAALPPVERRGLVLIDPPFEDKDEFATLAEAMGAALRKWATGTYAVWYPIKDPAPVARLAQALRALEPVNTVQIDLLRDPNAAKPTALRGCGLFVVNPPYVLAEEASLLLPFLAKSLGTAGEPPWRATLTGADGLARGFTA